MPLRSSLAISTFLLGLTVALTQCAALAQGSPAPANRTLAGSCSGCHGPAGQGSGAMPAIAGLPEAHLAQLLAQFRAGQRPASVMHQLARGYSEEEIAALARHFAGLPRAK
jgi:cytochrome c553